MRPKPKKFKLYFAGFFCKPPEANGAAFSGFEHVIFAHRILQRISKAAESVLLRDQAPWLLSNNMTKAFLPFCFATVILLLAGQKARLLDLIVHVALLNLVPGVVRSCPL